MRLSANSNSKARDSAVLADTGSSISSTSGDATLMKEAMKTVKKWINYFKLKYFEFTLTPKFMTLIPTIMVIASYTLCATIFNIAATLELPSLVYYNTFHVGAFFSTEFVIMSTVYAFHQLDKFRASWNLVFARTTLKRLHSSVKGDLGPSRNIVWVFLTLLQGFSLGLFFFAEWTPQSTPIGYFPCTKASYTETLLGGFTVDPDDVSGDIDFALVYMYGLPLADGIITGFAPWPDSAPLSTFQIGGDGPALVVEVNCDSDINSWNGTAPISLGNGFLVTSSIYGSRSFNINLDVFLPAVGIADVNLTTTWGVQACSITGYLSKTFWTFSYQVDEWQMVTAGQATGFEIM